MTNSLIIEDLTLVPIPPWWQNPWWWLLGAVLLAGIAYAARRFRPAPAPAPAPAPVAPPGPPPHLEALRRLAEVRRSHAGLGAYAVAVQCSDILRAYIEGRFALAIRYQTTREFLGEAQTRKELSEKQRADLGVFLKFCDLIKFAQVSAKADETLGAIGEAERFVRDCIPAPPAAADPDRQYLL